VEAALRNTVIISLILAVSTFFIGYYIYNETTTGESVIQIKQLPEVLLHNASHNALGPVLPSSKIRFTVLGEVNSSVLVQALGNNYLLEQIKPGHYSSEYSFDQVKETIILNTSVLFTSRAGTVVVQLQPIYIDLTPPQVNNVTVNVQNGVLKVVMKADVGANATASIKDFFKETPMTEFPEGVYTTIYTLRKGDYKNGVKVEIAAFDTLGNTINLEKFIYTLIETPGPKILGLETNYLKPLLKNECIDIIFRGEINANVTLETGHHKVELTEESPGRYSTEICHTLDKAERELYLNITQIKDKEEVKRSFGTFKVDDSPPSILSLNHNASRPLHRGEELFVTLIAEPNGKAFYQIIGTQFVFPMDEIEEGIYKAVREITDAEANSAYITATFYDEAGNPSLEEVTETPFSVDLETPLIINFTYIAKPPIGLNEIITFSAFAEPDLIATVYVSNYTVQLIEETPGRYSGIIQIDEVNKSFVSPVILTVKDKAENEASTIADPIIINTIMPEITSLEHNVRETLEPGSILTISMTAEPDGIAWVQMRDIEHPNTPGKDISLTEMATGEYVGNYLVTGQEAFKEAVLVGFFKDSAGNPAKLFVAVPELARTPFQFTTLLGATFLILIFPLFLFFYNRHASVSAIEDKFPDFLSDLHSIMGSQLPLPQALKIIKTAEYGKLSKRVKILSNRIELGHPFPLAFKQFAKETGSKSITSAVTVLISAYKAGGGRLAQIFGATADNFRQIRKLKRERISELQVHIISGYVIFILFLGILLVLNNYLFATSIQVVSSGAATEAISQTADVQNVQRILETARDQPGKSKFTDILFYLFFIQAFFSGLSIGELTEGTFMAGVKHAVVLMTIALFAANFLI